MKGAGGSVGGLLPLLSPVSPADPSRSLRAEGSLSHVDIDGKQRHSKPEGIGTMWLPQAES